MDTGIAYIALSGPLETLVKSNKQAKFYEEYEQWFPWLFCPEHRHKLIDRSVRTKKHAGRECCGAKHQYDCCTPGLFKAEFAGDEFLALNSKTYCCWRHSDGTFKYSSKRLSKATNSLEIDFFLDVLYSRESMAGTIKRFQTPQQSNVHLYARKSTVLAVR